MKPIYPQRNKPRFWKQPVGFVLILLLLVFLGGGVFTNLGGRVTIAIFRPIFLVKNSTVQTLNQILSYFESKRHLALENASLRQDLTRSKAQLLLFSDLQRENELLRAILGKTPETLMVSLAQVLHRPNQSPYDTIIVDLGANNSEPPIRAGMSVIFEGQWLLGEVATVYGNTAKIALFSGANRETPVTIGESGITAIAEGRGSGNFLVSLPRSIEVTAGVTVKTVWGNKLWPIGIVAEVKSDPSDAFQTVIFKNPVNVYEIRQVEIVTK